jgi:hypothetical protein
MKSDGETGLPVASMRSVYVMVLRARANTRVVVKPSLLNMQPVLMRALRGFGFLSVRNVSTVEGELVGGMTSSQKLHLDADVDDPAKFALYRGRTFRLVEAAKPRPSYRANK